MNSTSTLLLGVLIFFPGISFAATYPASCPVEAQGILEAVGGCAAVNESDYGAIYTQCCRAVTMDTANTTPAAPTTLTTPTTPPAASFITSFFIKPATANIRACAGTSCKVVGQLKQNTKLELPYGSLGAMPEWVKYESGGLSGYVSKTVLSDKKVTPAKIETTKTPETPGVVETHETPETPPEEPPLPKERAMPKILLITGILMWLAVFLALVVKLVIKFYLYLGRKFPGYFIPQKIFEYLELHSPRMIGFLNHLMKNFLIWGTLAFAIGLGTI